MSDGGNSKIKNQNEATDINHWASLQNSNYTIQRDSQKRLNTDVCNSPKLP
jgi:hypothetical protein